MHLSAGIVAGIAIAGLVACSASAYAVHRCLQGRRRRQPTPYHSQKGVPHPRISIDTSRASRFIIQERAMNLQMLNSSPETDTDHDSFSVPKRHFTNSVVLDIRKHSDEFNNTSSPITSIDAAPSPFTYPTTSSAGQNSSSVRSTAHAPRLRSRSVIKGDHGKRYSEPPTKSRPRASTSDVGSKLTGSSGRRSSLASPISEVTSHVPVSPAAPARHPRPLPVPPTGRPPTLRHSSSQTDSGIRIDTEHIDNPIPWKAIIPHYDTRPPMYTP